MDYKVEWNITYPDKSMLTWGPFYFHSRDNAIEKTEEVLQFITVWCNGKDPSLNIKPLNLKRLCNGEQIIFNIQAWKNENTLENCDGIITVEIIMFED